VYKYSGPAYTIADNLSAHTSGPLIAMAAEKNIHFIFFPPHSSDQLQPLDLVTFGLHKKLMKAQMELSGADFGNRQGI